MKIRYMVILCILSCLYSTPALRAQDKTKISSMEERLIKLEEGQKNLNKRFDDVNKRIDDLRIDMNSRFEDMKAKFNWLYIMLFSIIALNAAMVGSVVWLARQDRPIGKRHYDEIVDKEIKFERRLLQLSNDIQMIKSHLNIST